MTDETRVLSGGCHCGAVRFSCRVPSAWRVLSCNCSMCSRTAYLHLIVSQGDFTLHSGRDDLTCYTFNTGVAQHLFCRHCGIKSFYVPRSHPDCFSVNARCLDGIDPEVLEVQPFDGKHWEQARERL